MCVWLIYLSVYGAVIHSGSFGNYFGKVRHFCVCLNAQISAVIEARDCKFGIEICVCSTQLKLLSNCSCHAYLSHKCLFCIEVQKLQRSTLV